MKSYTALKISAYQHIQVRTCTHQLTHAHKCLLMRTHTLSRACTTERNAVADLLTPSQVSHVTPLRARTHGQTHAQRHAQTGDTGDTRDCAPCIIVRIFDHLVDLPASYATVRELETYYRRIFFYLLSKSATTAVKTMETLLNKGSYSQLQLSGILH